MTNVAHIEKRLLNFSNGLADRLPGADIQNAAELISNGEWGVGLEILCDQLAEYGIDLNAAEANELKEIALAMELDFSTFGIKH